MPVGSVPWVRHAGDSDVFASHALFWHERIRTGIAVRRHGGHDEHSTIRDRTAVESPSAPGMGAARR